MHVDESVREYYDDRVEPTLAGFVEGNWRIECGWRSIVRFAPRDPRRILEVGCGIGSTAWRMSRQWPDATVVGMDISPRLIETARALFQCPSISFSVGLLDEHAPAGPFDMVVLLDVYEHIGRSDREIAHNALVKRIHKESRIVLTFPTPRKQAFLREYLPDELQPVDEDISAETIAKLAADLGMGIRYYEEMAVFAPGDYAHAVLGSWPEWSPAPTGTRVDAARVGSLGIVSIAKHAAKSAARALRLRDRTDTTRLERLALVRSRLGDGAYPSGRDTKDLQSHSNE